MGDPISTGLGGGGMGATLGFLNFLGNKKANQNARALDATMAKWSPWLGATATHQQVAVPKARLMKDVLSGMGSGADFASKNPGLGSALANATNFNGPLAGGGGADAGGADVASSAGVGGLAELLPFAGGGIVPGSATMPGDSYANDTKAVRVSPGEGIIPRSVMQKPKQKVAAYLGEMKKKGPGFSPPSSMSPWAAMAGLGKGN